MQTPALRPHQPAPAVDLDSIDRPKPMEELPPKPAAGASLQVAQQPQRVEVLHSIERPGITPVFGSTLPPKGLSGVIRRRAFRHSESDLRHWLMLLAADRVDMVEGIVSDLARGHVPNIYREMGGRAELRHNPRGAAKKALVLAAVAGVAIWAWQRSGSRGGRR
jgi:hypothetical protein